jgi:murein DD-endopeptidase MepM/ murein hydrolase activator NlpD|tara:strand:- start:2843 stop:3310 length:468 start_codon:yes stop_codon:yes gene_type:complete
MALFKPVDPDLFIITSPFGQRINPITNLQQFHNGIDIGVPTGTPVYAIDDGVVTKVNIDAISGLYIVIDHGSNLVSKYMHLKRSNVKPGDKVNKADVIALSGSSGKVTAPHLHFEIFKNAKPIDPGKESLYTINYSRIVNGFLIAIPIYVFFLKK